MGGIITLNMENHLLEELPKDICIAPTKGA